MPTIESKLKQIFDFQIIAKNNFLETLIKSTESRYKIKKSDHELSDDDLEIFAAGDIHLKDSKFSKEDKDE